MSEEAMESNCRVLLVEDDPSQVVVVQVLLARMPKVRFTLDVAASLSEAMSLVARLESDVVLLDLTLPDSRGIDTVLRMRECAPAVPIIVLTGNDDEELALKSIESGAQDYVIKGIFDGRLLARSIRYSIQRLRSERSMATQRHRQRLIMESIPDCRIYFKDENGKFLEVNRALAIHSGLRDPQEAVGKSDFDLFGEEHARLAAEDEREVMRSGKSIVGKVEKEIMRDGRTCWALTTKMPLLGADGGAIGVFGVSRDISELKRAEEQLIDYNDRLTNAVGELLKSNEELKATQLQLIQAEKLRSLGQMAASVAHEVKNPLAILHMGIECLDEYFLERDEQMNTILVEMKDAVHRAEAVIRDMLDYSSARNLELRAMCMNVLIHQTLRFVRHDLNKCRVKVFTKLAQDLPPSCLDAAKMEQVLVNLLVNACHAMPDGGVLTIDTFQKTIDEDDPEPEREDCEAARFRKGDPVVVVEIRDTGTGVPEDKLGRIFDPFFTTKKPGSGTGLGLSVVKKIIDLHGGRIGIANAAGGGARVTLVMKALINAACGPTNEKSTNGATAGAVSEPVKR